jgi:hypothetical protein
MNILQTPTPCKSLNTNILRPKYTPRGEGGTPLMGMLTIRNEAQEGWR